MGFDVSWHPISQKEMFRWYFDPLEKVRIGDFSSLQFIAEEYQLGKAAGHEEVCLARYREIMETAAQVQPGDSFDKTHSFILAAVQGLFRTFYYTRGSLYSDLAAERPEMAAYTTPFQVILGDRLQNPVENRIFENYCGGVYIGENQVPQLLDDYSSGRVKDSLESRFGSTLPVFLKALNHAKGEGLGLLEATEIVEPNPIDLPATTCRSYLMNCDFDGVAIYAAAAKAQLEAAIRAQGDDPAAVQVERQVHVTESPIPPVPESPAKKRSGLLKKLFGEK